MSTWKRISLSLAGLVLSILAVGIFTGVTTSSSDPDGPGVAISFALAASIFAAPGWIMSLPLVIFFKNLESHRLWLVFCLGSILGPLVFLILGVGLRFPEDCGVSLADSTGVARDLAFSFSVSMLATVFYVSMLKSRSKRIQPTT